MFTTGLLPRQANRIVLRRLTIADLDAFQAYRSDPEVGQYQGWAPMSEVEARGFLAEMEKTELFSPGKWSQIAIADSLTNHLLGDIGICLSGDQCEVEIGFTLSSSHQGKGLASEAVGEAVNLIFEQTQALLVKGITDSRNLRSMNTLARVGMRRAEVVQTTFRGAPCTEFVYLIRRSPDG
ncbi:MAG: GNAT family N-acetyltransferase [Planctomycetes bacterium]|nr:GNAT family N-acetyltransferase [Planctomycetota bacterium]